MFGFSTEQLLLLAFVCLVVLGPRKTVETAYFLGRKARGLKRYFDEVKSELDISSVSSVTAEIGTGVRQDTDAMTASLRDAVSETDDVLKDVKMQLSQGFDKRCVQKSETDDNREPPKSVSDAELLQRVSALEHEIRALREELLLRRIS